MRDKHDDEKESSGDSSVLILSASLFMILLAFFIVLNAFSAANIERVQSAFHSVNAAFGFVGLGLSETPGVGDQINTGDTQQETAMGLRSVLPDLGFQARQTGGTGSIMSVVIARSDIEDRWPALRVRLAELLMERNTGGKHSLQLIALDGASTSDSLASMAAQLEQEGVDADLLAIGFEEQGRAAIELRFIISGRG